uniref:Uncharacterized protein n=1 Tax=Strongyloides venezuelensis TaxID=75913 RepID=A0A0K0FD01_STRVS
MTFFDYNGVTFSYKAQAEQYFNLLHKLELSKVNQKYWDSTSTKLKHRKSLLRSNSYISVKKIPILRHSGSLTERKHFFSESRNSLLELSRSSSIQSLTQPNNHLSLRRNGVSGSNNALWPRRHSVSGSTKDFLSGRNSVFGSSNDLSSGKNYISISTGDSSGRRKSLSMSRESLNNIVIGNEINEELFDKKI